MIDVVVHDTRFCDSSLEFLVSSTLTQDPNLCTSLFFDGRNISKINQIFYRFLAEECK